ncbi:MAG: Tryptophan-tRNA ligase [Parcubacteria group bacterium GW2011_GWF2_39_13b]|nr:MAG: Tryptophan-tRNA ligase [Parcubacteria group bacterium GW2011_GWF2_39_13b]
MRFLASLGMTALKMKIVFSGVAPSGTIHLGNYLGAIKNWVELQKTHSCVFCVVDLHAITIPQDPTKLRQKILEVAAIYLATGIDPEKSIVFIQSYNPNHTELAWILNTIAKISEMERMTQFKDKSRENKLSINMGLFDYPVLMAADILLYNTDIVPVGEDQKQHVELARTLARRFNQQFGETFKIPESKVEKEGARIMGLDDPTKKMSKSASSPFNYIALTDAPGIIRDKIKKAVTDSGNEIKYNIQEKPAISNLLAIFSLVTGKTIPQLEKKYASHASYIEFKKDLAEAIVVFLSPFQEKYNELMAKPEYLNEILESGAQKAREISRQKLENVKEKIGLL